MDMLSLSFRMVDKNTYYPYRLIDETWTEMEKELINSWMLMNHPEKVSAMYNEWLFTKVATQTPRFATKRSTYDTWAWWSTDLLKLLHVVVLASGDWTLPMLESAFPTREITAEEAILLPFAWYADRPDYQREFYQSPRRRFVVELPYVTSVFFEYSDTAFYEHRTIANLP